MNERRVHKQTIWQAVLLFCARVALLASILLAGVYCLDYARHPPELAAPFKLQLIRYQGLRYLQRDDLDRLIRRSSPDNLLLIDLERVRDLVESESWVKQAIVRRKLPNQLLVHVEERNPVAMAAIDSELYIVDETGTILDRPSPSHQQIDLPIVQGLKNVAQENAAEENAQRMVVYLQVLKELSSYHNAISEIDVEMPDQVAVILHQDPVHIYLGNRDFLRRYQNFIAQKDLYEQLKEEYGIIQSVDVSYENKIIFHTPQKKEEKVTGQQSNPS